MIETSLLNEIRVIFEYIRFHVIIFKSYFKCYETFAFSDMGTIVGHLSQSGPGGNRLPPDVSTRRQSVVIGVLARRNASSQDRSARYRY
jgi:hypothetical protein